MLLSIVVNLLSSIWHPVRIAGRIAVNPIMARPSLMIAITRFNDRYAVAKFSMSGV